MVLNEVLLLEITESMKRILTIILQYLCVFIVTAKASGRDAVGFAQRAQLGLENGNELSIGIKFNTSMVIAALRRQFDGRNIKNRESMFLELDDTIVSTVTTSRSDYLVMQKACIAWDSEFRTKYGLSISDNLLAFAMANETRTALQNGDCPVPHNCLLVSKDPCWDESTGSDAVIRVDMSGNYFNCRAACIGGLSQRIEAWLETRGVYLAAEKVKERHSGDLSSWEEADRDVHCCLSILCDCLRENIGLEAVHSNYTVEISSVQQSSPPERHLRHAPGRHFLRPTFVPDTVFAGPGNDSTRLSAWWTSTRNGRHPRRPLPVLRRSVWRRL